MKASHRTLASLRSAGSSYGIPSHTTTAKIFVNSKEALFGGSGALNFFGSQLRSLARRGACFPGAFSRSTTTPPTQPPPTQPSRMNRLPGISRSLPHPPQVVKFYATSYFFSFILFLQIVSPGLKNKSCQEICFAALHLPPQCNRRNPSPPRPPPFFLSLS